MLEGGNAKKKVQKWRVVRLAPARALRHLNFYQFVRKLYTAVSWWKFSSRMRSTGKIELIIISLVNTKLCICINLASMATLWAKI